MSESCAFAAAPTQPRDIGGATTEYIKRCEILLTDAFERRIDERSAFRDWFERQLAASANPWLLLHEDPLYVTSRYLGIPPAEIESSITSRAYRIALDHGWTEPDN